MTEAQPATLAQNLRHLREEAKRSRRELARAAGISQSYVEKLELGYVHPARATVRALARALDVTITYLEQDLVVPSRPERPQDIALAGVVRAARKAAGMTREALARAAGITPGYLMEIEIGRRMPSPSRRRALAAALGVSEARLVKAASKWRPFSVGGVVRELRRAAGLTRSKLATLAGISPHYLAAIERGIAIPSAESIDGLAAALRVEPAVVRARLDGPVRHRARRSP
jgi:transcriptional regulator with XRE-family HTH domain